ncbi:MAG: NAD(P)-dependent alcohol dehydrogenase [Hyphomicrobiales bacterium]|nr:NAD(P)-dependent alcohol dehydrogenase [Hyphomicrobiales bacterium]
MKAYEIVSDGGIDALALNDRPDPEPGPGQVLVRVRASSINYRDLSTIADPVPRGIPYPRIPNSDGAGQVLAVGPGVTRFAPGDRVAGCFFQDWEDGPITPAAMASALGGALDGVLAEQVVLSERGLVAVPEHLSYEEAATLPCAALTAWHAMVGRGGLKAGDTVLLLGTGGVSVFALQFAVLHGARAIVTSSGDDKLARARDMGAWETVNYRATPDWEKAVLDLTGGRGVDQVVEVGGAGTFAKSLDAARVGGRVSLIGILTGGAPNPVAIMRKSLTVQGIYVGSRTMFEDMNRAVAAHRLRPVIDRVFDFADARAAYHHQLSGAHFGKVVVRIEG